LLTFVNYSCKKINNIDTWDQCYKTFTRASDEFL
jgi:hypothetical protein